MQNDNLDSVMKTSEDTIVNYDSIKVGYGGHLLYNNDINPTDMLTKEAEKPKPLERTIHKSLLGDIGGKDTLKIFAEFSQCGEFGGNREYLNVYRNDSILECRIIKDSVVCRYDENGQKFFRVEDKTYSLSKSGEKAVVDYLELLLRYTLKEKEWYANAAGYFSATINRGKYMKDFSVDVFDSEMEWIYFDLLKNEIKTTANKSYKK